MFYKFNNVIGRIAPSTQAAAYTPQGLTPLAREPSVITFDSKKTKPVQEPAVKMTRPASSSPATSSGSAAAPAGEPLGIVPTHPRYQRIVQMQNAFLKDDGLMVWQKFPRDRANYYVTIGLVVAGSAALVAQLYKWSFPRQTQD